MPEASSAVVWAIASGFGLGIVLGSIRRALDLIERG